MEMRRVQIRDELGPGEGLVGFRLEMRRVKVGDEKGPG